MPDGVTRLLAGIASLPLGTGRGPSASSLVAYWVAMLNSSTVVYLAMLFSAWKHDSCYASCPPLLDAFGPCPLGPRLCPSWGGIHADIRSVHPCAPRTPEEMSGTKPKLVRELFLPQRVPWCHSAYQPWSGPGRSLSPRPGAGGCNPPVAR
jgi:hypothetical protein